MASLELIRSRAPFLAEKIAARLQDDQAPPNGLAPTAPDSAASSAATLEDSLTDSFSTEPLMSEMLEVRLNGARNRTSSEGRASLGYSPDRSSATTTRRGDLGKVIPHRPTSTHIGHGLRERRVSN